jgi:site-specific DNA recombinase
MFQEKISRNIRVAFYIRVSTDEQRKDGFWPEMQMQWLEEMITYREKINWWTHDKNHTYVDPWCTGADLNRPEFKRMMQDAEDGKFDMIAVWKIDRLSRNLSHLLSTFETLQKHKVGFFSLKENIDFTWPIWKLTFQIFGALAEFERETIRMRTQEGKATSARFWNFVINSTPYWYKKESSEKKRNRSLIILEQEALWIKRIFEEFIGWKSLEQIAKILNESKVQKNDDNLKKDKLTKWYGSTVKKILINPVYTWRAVYRIKDDNGNIDSIEIPTPRIISDITYELAQNRLESLNSDAKRWGGDNKYLLSRKIVDMQTGRKFVWVIRPKDKRVSYRRKHFVLDGITYKNMEIPWEPIEKLVWDTIYKMVNRPKELFEIFQRQSIESKNYEALLKEHELNQLEIERLERKENEIEMDYYDGKLSEEKKDKLISITIEQKTTKEQRNVDLNIKLDAIVKAEETKLALEKFQNDFETNLENLTFEQKQLLVDLLVEVIEVTTVSSQLNLNIKLRFDQSKVLWNDTVGEPKKSSPEPQSDDWRANIDNYGATSKARTCDLLLRREAL